MRDGRIRGRMWGLAACAVALLLLVAAAIVGTTVYSAPLPAPATR